MKKKIEKKSEKKDLIKNEKVGSYFRSDLYKGVEIYNWSSHLLFIPINYLHEGYCIKINDNNIILEIYGCVKP